MSATRDALRLIGLTGLRPWRFLVAVTLGATTVLCAVGLLGLSGYLISRASQQPPILSLTVVIVLVRLLALARPLSRYGERLVSHDLAFRLLGRLRSVCFERIEPLAPAELEAYRDGELLGRLVRDVDEIQDLVLRVLLPLTVAAVTVPAIVVGIAVVLPAAGLVAAAGLLAAATAVPLLTHRLTARGQRRQATLRGALTAELVEALDAAPELWLCGADAAAADAIVERDRDLVATSLADARGAGWADALSVAVTGLTGVAVLAMAAAAASRGALDPLLVAPLTMVVVAAFEAVLPLSVAARSISAVLASTHRVLDLTDRSPEVVDPDDPRPAPAPGPAIELVEVTADRGRGAARHRVLDGIDLDLPAGRRVVVTGPSGSGKSTLLQVLVRFLERSGGRADLDGHDLRAYRQDDVRRQLLLLEQDPHVFDSNLRENVAFARPGCGDGEITEALRRAQLGDWLATLPEGLDTRVGSGGSALSGGQRQRLAMARAFLADPSVLLLDEPTAHLDRPTADALLRDLDELAGERSVVLVTHGDAGSFGAASELRLGPTP